MAISKLAQVLDDILKTPASKAVDDSLVKRRQPTKRSERDYPDINLSTRHPKLTETFLEDHGYVRYDVSMGGNKAGTYDFVDDGIKAYTEHANKKGFTEKTFKNPTLKQLKNWMQYGVGSGAVGLGLTTGSETAQAEELNFTIGGKQITIPSKKIEEPSTTPPKEAEAPKELSFTIGGKEVIIPADKKSKGPIDRTTVAKQEDRDRNLLEKGVLSGEVLRAAGIEILMSGASYEDIMRDGGYADAADAAFKVWDNPDHKVKTSFMQAINEQFDEIYKTEQEQGANYLSDKAKWKSKYEFELAGYELVGKEMPKEERELFEKHIKYSSDFSFMNWLARPENAHLRAAYTVSAGLSADLFIEPLALIFYPIVAGFKALKGTAKFTDKAVTGGKGAEKVAKIKEARKVKKLKKASDKAAKLATELEKKVEKLVLVDKMDPFKAAQKAWDSTPGKTQIILGNYKRLFGGRKNITGPEDIEKSLHHIYGTTGLEAIAKASTAAEITIPKHLIPTKMKKMFDSYKNTTAHKIITKPLGKLGEGSGKQLDDIFGLALTRIKLISPKIAAKLTAFEFKLAINFNSDVRAVGPWLMSYSKLAKPQQKALDKALYSQKFDEARLIMSETKGMVDEFDTNVLRILEGKRKQLQGVSKKNIGVVNYFPRNVSDTKGLNAWQQAKIDRVKGKGTDATDFDIDDTIATLNRDISQDTLLADRTLSAEKRRIIKEIDDTNIDFYNSSDNSLVNYIREVNHQVGLRKFLGKSGKTPKYIDDIDSHIDDSIKTFVQEEMELGRLASEDVDLLKDILKSRFVGGEAKLAASVRDVKNIGYLVTIANPYSALIQFGDIGGGAFTNGVINTVVAAAKVLKGGKRISYEETFGQKLMAEMAHSNAKGKLNLKNIRSSGDVLDVAMSLSQFKRVDMFGKDVVLNGALRKWSNIGKDKALQAEFRIKYKNSFTEKEMDNLISDFSNLRIYAKSNTAPLTDDIKFVLFNELLDVQPITMSQMPTAYLNAAKVAGGSGRLLYQLKTFTLKQMDMVRTRALQKIANGRVVEGTVELARYGLILGGTNAGAQTAKRQIQDWIEGGDRLDRWLNENPTPSLMIFNNVMKLWGVGEREQNYFKDGRIKKLYADQVTPVILSKGSELAQVMFGNKEFYDFVLRTIPKPIANPSFFTSYAVANFFSAQTSDDLIDSNKRARERNRNRPKRQERPDRPTRQRAR